MDVLNEIEKIERQNLDCEQFTEAEKQLVEQQLVLLAEVRAAREGLTGAKLKAVDAALLPALKFAKEKALLFRRTRLYKVLKEQKHHTGLSKGSSDRQNRIYGSEENIAAAYAEWRSEFKRRREAHRTDRSCCAAIARDSRFKNLSGDEPKDFTPEHILSVVKRSTSV